MSRDDVLDEDTPSIAAATLNEDRMLGRRSRPSEFKLIRVLTCALLGAAVDNYVLVAEMSRLRQQSLYPN